MFKQIVARIVVALFASAFLSAQPIQAQDRAGILQGVVKDSEMMRPATARC
jgi:hypothetical protein